MPKPKKPARTTIHKPRLPSEEPVEMTLEMQRRFDALATPTATEMDCSICGQGKGLPKIDGPDMRCCVVCWGMLAEMLPTKRLAILTLVAENRLNRDKWMEYRLEPFGRWLMSEGRMRVPTNVVENIA